MLRLFRRLGLGKGIRTDGPESHQEKSGTPTLGGVLIWGTVFVSTAIFNVVNNLSIAVPLLATAATGVLGTIDDLLSLAGRGGEGIQAWVKMAALIGIATAVAVA